MIEKIKAQITGADLKFRHFELAKRLSMQMLDAMNEEKLSTKDIPQVLNDLCKFVVLSEATTSKEGALLVVKRFAELSRDVTCLMMRIVQGQVMDDFK